MSNYFVRLSGSDSNDGLTPATAWRTFNKSLSSTGATSGDIIYVGGGVYRETIVVGMTAATSEVLIIGDIDGIYTGDFGEIRLTNFTKNDYTTPSVTVTLSMTSKAFLTFKNILFETGADTRAVDVITSNNISFVNCYFVGYAGSNQAIMNINPGSTTDRNILLDSCSFFGVNCLTNVLMTISRSSTGDYDCNIRFNNCLFLSNRNSVTITSGGAGGFFGGGITFSRCTIYGALTGNGITISTAFVSSIYPCYVFNCLIFTGVSVVAARIGQIIENHNKLQARTLTSIGLESTTIRTMLIDIGQNLRYKNKNIGFGVTPKDSPSLKVGNNELSSQIDAFGNIGNAGGLNLISEGTLTSVDNRTITDSSKTFGNSNLAGYSIKMLNGTAAGYIKTINGNTNTVISGDGLWPINPSIGDRYVLYTGPTSLHSKASTGQTLYGFRDNYANWGTNNWVGYTCEFTSGTASGQNFIVSGNTAIGLTGYYPMSIIPTSGDVYKLYQGGILKSTVSTGSSYTLTDNNANWNPPGGWPTGHFWYGWRCMIIEGVASGANFCISGNSQNTLSGWNSFSVIPQSGDKYVIYQNTGNFSGYYPSGYIPNYGENVVHCSVGCYQPYDTAIKETGMVLSGANSIRLFGPGIQDFQVPVSGVTTLSVFGYYDDYYFGTNPQLKILNGSGIGIADNTATMLGVSGQWEQLRLSFTGSSAGVITARLQSNATGIGGSAYFDCFNVS